MSIHDEKKDPLEALEQQSLSQVVSDDEVLWGPKPTEEEVATLRKVTDKLSWSTWLVAIVELGERFTYYGVSGPFQNYMQLERGTGHRNGGLGLGQQAATALSYFFQFWCYVTPILGAVVADKYVGKYKAICIFAGVYVIGTLILFVTSLPVALDNGAGLGGLAAAMVIIGIGTGGIKSNVGPMIADQYTNTKQYTKVLKSGEKIATTFMEHDIDFWAAYLLPFCFFFIGILSLVAGRKIYVKRPPQGSVIPDTFKILFMSARNGFNLESTKPSTREANGQPPVGWSDLFVDEVRRSLYACKVFLAYPIFWLVYGQMVNNFVSQAGQMSLHGMPNDVLQSVNSMTVLLFIPIINKIVYPSLRRIGINMRPITRMTCGFFMCAVAMAYAAIVQHLIYQSGPCYDKPLECPASDGGKIPNDIHVGIQAPAYAFIALAEIFASVTGLEYAYTKAPANMKSFIMAMFLLTNSGGSALGIALSSVSVNPKVLWLFVGLSASTAIATCIFYLVFRDFDSKEEELNAIDAEYTAKMNKQLKEEIANSKNDSKV